MLKKIPLKIILMIIPEDMNKYGKQGNMNLRQNISYFTDKSNILIKEI